MSSDEAGLVRALLADPWDELARSAYADWLDDQGQSLLADLMRSSTSPGQAGTTSRLQARLRETFADFSLDVDAGSGLLVARITSSAFLSPQFEGEGAGWLRRSHIVILAVAGPPPDWGRVALSPLAPSLRGLLLREAPLRGDGELALARDAAFDELASLELDRCSLSLAGATALLQSSAMPRLVRLALGQTEVGAGLLQALADGPLAGRLEHLGLADCQLGNRAVELLARQARLMGGLVALRVGGQVLSDRAAEALAGSPHLGRLRSLILQGGAVGDVGLQALADSPLLSRLRWLGLQGNRGGAADGYRALARQAATVPGLRLEVGRHLPQRLRDEMRELLGARLLER